MPGCVDKSDSVAGVFEEGLSRGHPLEDSLSALDPELLVKPTSSGDHTDERFGLVGVELIDDEDPGALGIGVDRLVDVGQKIGFGTGRPHSGSDDHSGGHFEVGDQA